MCNSKNRIDCPSVIIPLNKNQLELKDAIIQILINKDSVNPQYNEK